MQISLRTVLKGRGTHNELLGRCELYCDLYMLQTVLIGLLPTPTTGSILKIDNLTEMRVRSVCSVEDNQEWFQVVSQKKLANQTVIHRADESGYVKSLPEQAKQFEIIVVDGNWRKGCVVEATHCLKDGGMIVLDNGSDD